MTPVLGRLVRRADTCACLGWLMGATCLSVHSPARTDRVYAPERARTRRHRATTRARSRCPGMPSRRSRPAPRRGHPAAQRIAAPRRSGRLEGVTLRGIVTLSDRRNEDQRSAWRQARPAILTTILTTIAPVSGWSATVRRRSVCRLTCADGLRRTSAKPRPTAGGQGGAGSNPVSPTVEPRVRGGSPRLWREYSNRNSNAARIPACWSAKGACRHSSPLCQWRPACSRVPQRLADRVTAIKAGTPGGLAFVGALRGFPFHVPARRARVAVSFSRHRDCPAQCPSGSARSGAARPREWPAELRLRWRRPRRGGAWAWAGTAPTSVC